MKEKKYPWYKIDLKMYIFADSYADHTLKVEQKATPYLAVTEDIPDQMPDVFSVTINKNSGEGLGITIVGGEDSRRLSQGIFIKHIKPGSVCAKDGKLSEGNYRSLLVTYIVIYETDFVKTLL